MVNGSNKIGFGYDFEEHCLTVGNPVWEAYLQLHVHKEATKWKHKSFPYYEDICIVFGKDRAQGNRVRYFIEMEQDEISCNTTVQNEETTLTVHSSKRKRRSDDMFDNVVGLITKSLKQILKYLSQIIKLDMIKGLSEKIPP
uniref:Uncharacterized protein n=1 Tax=Lactuca sativa TaxID=4236 RepID=A0A9R1W7M4_LACSA|nr:hypothetical protein LSAT_V11C300109110 [Lactuca sativa]